MADPIWRPENFLYQNPMKNWTEGFEGTPITNLLPDFENMADPIWRPENFLYHNPMKNWTKGFEGTPITNSLSGLENFGNPKWRINVLNAVRVNFTKNKI